MRFALAITPFGDATDDSLAERLCVLIAPVRSSRGCRDLATASLEPDISAAKVPKHFNSEVWEIY